MMSDDYERLAAKRLKIFWQRNTVTLLLGGGNLMKITKGKIFHMKCQPGIGRNIVFVLDHFRMDNLFHLLSWLHTEKG